MKTSKSRKNKKTIIETEESTVQFSKIYEDKNIREILLKYFEEGCVDIIPELYEYTKDETISTKKNIKAPIIRKWLNLMHEKSIVEFTRKRDKKTGWFTYYWKIRPEKIIELAISDIDKEIKELENEIEETKTHNFACDCKTWTYVEALESSFVCVECGKIIEEKNNEELIAEKENKKKILENKKKDILHLLKNVCR